VRARVWWLSAGSLIAHNVIDIHEFIPKPFKGVGLIQADLHSRKIKQNIFKL
jgi:hypothetical protein